MLNTLFNITNRKQGGIRFIKLGRITLSISVTSKTAYAAKQAKEARQAVINSMLIVERDASMVAVPHGWTREGYVRHLDVVMQDALHKVAVEVERFGNTDDVWFNA